MGEEIVILKSEVPMVDLVPHEAHSVPRVPGSLRGQIKIGSDFDAPLPDDIAVGLLGATS